MSTIAGLTVLYLLYFIETVKRLRSENDSLSWLEIETVQKDAEIARMKQEIYNMQRMYCICVVVSKGIS